VKRFLLLWELRSELIMAARLATAIGYVTVGLGILKDQMTGDLNRLVENLGIHIKSMENSIPRNPYISS